MTAEHKPGGLGGRVPRWGCALLATALSSCALDATTPAPDGAPTAEQQAITAAALTAWERGFGGASLAGCEPATLSWRLLPDDELQLACGPSQTGSPCWGCLLARRTGIVLAIIDTPDREQRRWTEAHEVAHWLERCSGRWPRGDYRHADPDVWPRQVDDTMALVVASEGN